MPDSYQEFDPFADASGNNIDCDAYLAGQGWEGFLGLGDIERSSLALFAWSRTLPDKTTEYIVEVHSQGHGNPPYIKVDGLVALMDLFSRWAPAVQAASVVDVIDDLRAQSLNTYEGLVEQIAARAAHGIENTLPVLRRGEERRRERRKEREAVKVSQNAG